MVRVRVNVVSLQEATLKASRKQIIEKFSHRKSQQKNHLVSLTKVFAIEGFTTTDSVALIIKHRVERVS